MTKNKQMSEQLIVLKRFLSTKYLTVFPFFTLGLACGFLYTMSSTEKLVSVNFEVYGRVQGVFFRKYTEKEANKLGLRGWCKNTPHDTVQGIIEGNPTKIAEMKAWLQKTGSPQSRIDKAIFNNEHDVAKHNFDSFSIKR